MSHPDMVICPKLYNAYNFTKYIWLTWKVTGISGHNQQTSPWMWTHWIYGCFSLSHLPARTWNWLNMWRVEYVIIHSNAKFMHFVHFGHIFRPFNTDGITKLTNKQRKKFIKFNSRNAFIQQTQNMLRMVAWKLQDEAYIRCVNRTCRILYEQNLQNLN